MTATDASFTTNILAKIIYTICWLIVIVPIKLIVLLLVCWDIIQDLFHIGSTNFQPTWEALNEFTAGLFVQSLFSRRGGD